MSESIERLFFALWPDDSVRYHLTETYHKIDEFSGQGRLVDPENLHMTLHFLGNIPLNSIDCFLSQAEKVRSPVFKLTLNQMGYFKKPRVVWIGCESIPQALTNLHTVLGKMIIPCGYNTEQRPYRPHITMARKIHYSPEEKDIEGFDWTVTRFVLVLSRNLRGGIQYRIKKSYRLHP